MKYTLNDLIHAKGITETVQEAVMALLHENEELRVRLKEFENQTPVAWQAIGELIWNRKACEDDRPLYAKPVAQPNLSDPAVQKRLAAQWGYVPAGVQPALIVPDLLEALRLAADINPYGSVENATARDAARDAIAKATGGQP